MKEEYRKRIQMLMHEKPALLIFGAQLVAEEVAQCLMESPFDCTIDAFIVSSHDNNPKQLLGINVIDVNELRKKYSTERMVIIATMDKHVNSIIVNLSKQGFYNILPLSFECDEWSLVQDIYLQNYCKQHERSYIRYDYQINDDILMSSDSVHIYSVRSIYDKQLSEMYETDWEIPIQVGASLTDIKLCEVQDNEGDNISNRNQQYCELTALYWIWKHDKAGYKGLGHYRRHFCLSSDDIMALPQSGIDVLVTVPVLNFPNVKSVYYHDHSKKDWNVMVEAVRKIAPEYESAVHRLENSRYYYAYNMFIAREEIFNHYCEWLFSILFYCENNCSVHESLYQSRFIGFLAERLLTVYLFYHEEDYKIGIVDKHFVR